MAIHFRHTATVSGRGGTVTPALGAKQRVIPCHERPIESQTAHGDRIRRRTPRRLNRNRTTARKSRRWPMPRWSSSDAPIVVEVDDPGAYSGHMDERPLTVTTLLGDDSVDLNPHETTAEAARTFMSPGEAYHLVDDLQNAADACWGAVEYTVVAKETLDSPGTVLTSIMAPTPDDAVKRAVEYVQRAAEDTESFQRKATMAVEADVYQVFRADTSTVVRTDDNDD